MILKEVVSSTAYCNPSDAIVKCNCAGNAISIYLGSSDKYNGAFTIKKSDTTANTVTVVPYGSEKIDGESTATLTYENDYITFTPIKNGFAVIDRYTQRPALVNPVITGTGSAVLSKINPVSATNTLTISGTVLDGETVTIGDDVYEFCSDAAQTLTGGSTIAVDIEAKTTKATGTLTVATNPTATETIVIGPTGSETTYTFRASADFNAAGEILLGSTVAETQANIIGAIMGTDGVNDPDPYVTIGAFATNAATVTAKVGGTAGDAINTTETMAGASNAFAAATLASGADASKADGRTALVAAINAYNTENVTAAVGAGDTMTLVAAVGADGNSIATTETMSHGAFSSATMVGGSDQGMTSPLFTNMTHEVTVNVHDYDTGHVDWTLTPAEQLIPFHKVIQANAGANAVIPLTPSIPYTFINASSQTVTVKGASGNGIAIANAKTATVMADGTNVIRLTTDA